MEIEKEEISDEDKQEIDETEISEEGEASSGGETTSSGAGNSTSWSQGHTKGPGNQTGNTKWKDVVGSLLKRGKGNPLN